MTRFREGTTKWLGGLVRRSLESGLPHSSNPYHDGTICIVASELFYSRVHTPHDQCITDPTPLDL
jgi:hypothetical protein